MTHLQDIVWRTRASDALSTCRVNHKEDQWFSNERLIYRSLTTRNTRSLREKVFEISKDQVRSWPLCERNFSLLFDISAIRPRCNIDLQSEGLNEIKT